MVNLIVNLARYARGVCLACVPRDACERVSLAPSVFLRGKSSRRRRRGVKGLVHVSECEVEGRVQNFRGLGVVRVWGLGFRLWGSGFRVQGSGFRVQGLGFKF